MSSPIGETLTSYSFFSFGYPSYFLSSCVRFSERNIGRFHTSGISGSMKKFQKIKSQNESTEELNPEIKRLKKLIPEKLQIRQKEIEEDTKQLLELEQKLEEVHFLPLHCIACV
jgi:hypothetical protein